eukprot:c28899_g2_i2 orf=99-686(+)
MYQSRLLSFVLANVAMWMCLTSVLGDSVECENLPMEVCAFAVSSSGSRCVLEKIVMGDGRLKFVCQSSIVMAENFPEWIETDECINACGLDRMSVGMSTDTLVENDFTEVLCSEDCQDNCPNIFDLYTNLAAGEGVYLPHLCQAQRMSSRKLIAGGPQLVWASKSANTLDSWKASGPAAQPLLGIKDSALAEASA